MSSVDIMMRVQCSLVGYSIYINLYIQLTKPLRWSEEWSIFAFCILMRVNMRPSPLSNMNAALGLNSRKTPSYVI